MSAAPVRFEEVAYNYGFIPVEPHTNRGYCLVYRLFKECMDEPGKIVLIRGNEWVIQMKDISGPLEEREKITIFSQDIIDYYPFNFKSKAVGFLIQARRRSKTGYWFVVFRREGQLEAFCSFLYWLIHGQLPRHGRSLSPNRGSRSYSRYHTSPPRQRSRPRSQVCTDRHSSRYRGHESVVVSCNSSGLTVYKPGSLRASYSPSYTCYESSAPHRISHSAERLWHY
ncbi:hypothetical protein TSMEX_009912 [Taenia solium]|eukprot:TsM_000862900 transcript=TsM_000862900 gene=TsM_000862900